MTRLELSKTLWRISHFEHTLVLSLTDGHYTTVTFYLTKEELAELIQGLEYKRVEIDVLEALNNKTAIALD